MLYVTYPAFSLNISQLRTIFHYPFFVYPVKTIRCAFCGQPDYSASPWGIHDLPFVVLLFLGLRPLQDHLDSLVVVSLDLEVRYPAVALGCGNLAMPQEVLDGSKGSIGVEKLRGHGVAKPMTRDVQPALSRIVFDPLLDASDR